MMRNSHDLNQSENDYLIMPPSNRLNNKSSMISKSHQIRDQAYNGDSLSRTAITSPHL